MIPTYNLAIFKIYRKNNNDLLQTIYQVISTQSIKLLSINLYKMLVATPVLNLLLTNRNISIFQMRQ